MVILFDGVCNLCNGFVQFVLKHDKDRIFQFASLQSNYGVGLSKHFNLPVADHETIVLYDGKNVLTESDAVFKIVDSLGGIYEMAFVLKIFPKPVRDWFYRLVAKNRYKIFGKKDQCMVPTENVKDRFLDNVVFV
jgi:predicted DCC family thiol-disulfide oxidoreductase YuxK